MPNEQTGPRIVFLGMSCAGSVPPLAALLAAGHDVRAVVAAGSALPTPPPRGYPAWGENERVASDRDRVEGSDGAPGDVEGLADRAGVPVVRATGVGAVTEVVAAHRADAVVVACFPWRLPASLLTLPPLGCLNLHPSLLPRGQGPEPVFWTLRRGERRTGATVHLMDAGLDTGPVVARAEVDVPVGIRAPELEDRLMALGGRLLVDALPRLAAGEIAPVPQDAALATTAPPPTAADFAVPTNLPAGWAYAFVRGVAPLGGPLAVHVGATGERIPIRDALAYDPDEPIEPPVIDEGGGVRRVRFRPGWVRFAAG